MPTLSRGCRVSRADDRRPSFVRAGLSGRTIYFPDDFLAEHDREPGQLTALLTLSLSSYLGGKRGEA